MSKNGVGREAAVDLDYRSDMTARALLQRERCRASRLGLSVEELRHRVRAARLLADLLGEADGPRHPVAVTARTARVNR